MRFLIPLLLFLAACGQSGATAASGDTPSTDEPVLVSLSLYIVDEATEGPASSLSSQRDVPGVEQIAEGIQDIWEPSGIDFSVITIARIVASSEALSALARGGTSEFLDGLYSGSIAAPDPGSINGFYVRSIGSINGIAPFGARIFFVTDTPSVHDERVSSHEIGHILGLHHASDDSGRLMFSGTNGMDLVEAEIQVALYNAEGIANGTS